MSYISPGRGKERQYILIHGSGKLRPAYQMSYSSSSARTLLTLLRHPAEARHPSLCASNLISCFLLPLFPPLLHYVFLHPETAPFTVLLFLSWLSCHQRVVCSLIASDLGPVSGWLVFGGPGGGGGVLSSSSVRLPPSVSLPFVVVSLIAVRAPHWACPLSIHTLIGVITA